MSVGVQRAIGGTFGFAFAAVWVTAGLSAAVSCGVAAGLGYGAVRLRERVATGGVVGARDAMRRELQVRFAPSPRAARSTRSPRPASRHQQHARRPRREPAAAPAVADTATYGW